MSLAAYFQRSAVAASQVLSGFDERAIRDRLEGRVVGLEWADDAVAGDEGVAILELSVRLMARLYPKLSLRGPNREEYASLALRINPRIELSDENPEIAIVAGPGPEPQLPQGIFVGSNGWDAFISTSVRQPLGESNNPAGAAAAACLGAANVFRAVFLEVPQFDDDLTFSTLDLETRPSSENLALDGLVIPEPSVLVGAGAIGNAAAWLLGKLPLETTLHVVDHEGVELSNLQRYVLADEADEGRSKVEMVAAVSPPRLNVVPHQGPWADFTRDSGYRWDRVLVGLDSAADRRAVQASLPRWIANAWTQPGDLGVSSHPWTHGACLNCLYLPTSELPSEDALIAGALGLDDDPHRLQIRGLLHANASPPRQLLEEAASALGIEPRLVLGYEDRPLRDLYTEGICGGALLPLDRVGLPEQAVHVPLAHQSALAGVLLATRLVAHHLGRTPCSATATRINLLGPVPAVPTQPVAKDQRGICLCQDPVYQAAWDEKYN